MPVKSNDSGGQWWMSSRVRSTPPGDGESSRSVASVLTDNCSSEGTKNGKPIAGAKYGTLPTAVAK